MNKKLSEMSLEELWQLFPIFLTEHQECWSKWYFEEEKILRKNLPQIKRLSHIGSTAIPSIWAKPIIDILLEVPRDKALGDYTRLILNSGYICMSQSENRASFNKGYTENGFAERVFHLHLRHEGDNDEVYFRDYLIEHPDAAREYEELKLQLWKRFEHNRDAYTNAKTELVKKYTEIAKIQYMKNFRYITLRDEPKRIMEAAKWFHEKWGVPEEAYLECMEAYLSGDTEYGWYLCIDGEKIVGGLGVIENDFHERQDLAPNICAVYTDEDYRGQGIAGRLLDMAVKDAASKGISPVYLVTEHTGFYERYGWEFLCMVKEKDSEKLTRLYIHR